MALALLLRGALPPQVLSSRRAKHCRADERCTHQASLGPSCLLDLRRQRGRLTRLHVVPIVLLLRRRHRLVRCRRSFLVGLLPLPIYRCSSCPLRGDKLAWAFLVCGRGGGRSPSRPLRGGRERVREREGGGGVSAHERGAAGTRSKRARGRRPPRRACAPPATRNVTQKCVFVLDTSRTML